MTCLPITRFFATKPYYEWCIIERERLQREYLTAIQKYSDSLFGDAQYQLAGDWLQKAINVDPYNEELHVQYMRTLARSGQQQRVIAQYQYLTTLLQDAFGSDPMPETQAVYQQLMG